MQPNPGDLYSNALACMAGKGHSLFWRNEKGYGQILTQHISEVPDMSEVACFLLSDFGTT